ncbi:MAG: hypothetical protein J5778_06010 [Clostridiales bacterium]|nr:hypothetical protein [Clostridiales bacterium]
MDNKDNENLENIANETADEIVSNEEAVEEASSDVEASDIVDEVWEKDGDAEDPEDNEDIEDAEEPVFKAPKDKAKKRSDAIVTIGILLLVAVVAVGFIFWMIPIIGVTSFGCSVDDYFAKVKTIPCYQAVEDLSSISVNNINYQNDVLSSTITEDELKKGLSDLSETLPKQYFLKYFDCDVSSTVPADIVGCSRMTDGELVYIRFMAQFDAEHQNYSFMLYFFAAALQSVFPELSTDEASALYEQLMNSGSGHSDYIIRGNYAYRLSFGKYNDATYISMDLTPAANIK